MGGDADKFSFSSSIAADDSTANGFRQEDGPEDKDSQSPPQSSDEHMASSRSKDLNRPKRKKARRACGNCQRAHLTCGDERPCQRCIKRNIADNCHDGARKKAKYLHDAPNDALLPERSELFKQTKVSNSLSRINETDISPNHITSAHNASFLPIQTSQYPLFQPSTGSQTPIFQPMQDQLDFSRGPAQSSPPSSQFSPFQPTSMQQMPISRRQSQHIPDAQVASLSYTDPYFNTPNDLSLYDFDIASMDFGNHYGALEFGMLGHMSSGANERAVQNASAPMSALDATSLSTSSFPNNAEFAFDVGNKWQAGPLHLPGHSLAPGPSTMNEAVYFNAQSGPNAYVIGNNAGSISGASPASSGSDPLIPYDSVNIDQAYISSQQNGIFGQASLTTEGHRFGQRHHQQQQPQRSLNQELSLPVDSNRGSTKPRKSNRSLRQGLTDAKPRARDPSFIYSSYTEPYPYTIAFHRMTAFLQRRFSSQKRLRIAKALASIRPSFISLTQSLIKADLVFMEKCFQRGLWDYEEFSSACGTPTIICRRTGEVAHVDQEFTLMTGWTKEVLTGKHPNLNNNRHKDDSSTSGAATAESSRGGFNTPKNGDENPKHEPSEVTDHSQNALFLAELLDETSAIRFYEDYAKLAFADQNGSAWAPCKLLTYEPKEPAIGGHDSALTRHGNGLEPQIQSKVLDDKNKQHFGKKDGRVDCMCCWMVKRDVFNIPMMIVMNVLPVC